jgi:hypothetical protein
LEGFSVKRRKLTDAEKKQKRKLYRERLLRRQAQAKKWIDRLKLVGLCALGPFLAASWYWGGKLE